MKALKISLVLFALFSSAVAGVILTAEDAVDNQTSTQSTDERALNGSGPISGGTETWAVPLRSVTNKAFKAGESLTFVIKYEFVAAGTATMNVKQGTDIEGRSTLVFESKAESSKFVDNFFKVRDFTAAVSDEKTLASFRFHQNLKEGKYAVIRNFVFDYVNGFYTFEKTSKRKTTSTGQGTLAQPVVDILTAFFYTRTLDLKLGENYEITVFYDKTVYPLRINVHPKLERVRVPAGEFKCIRIEPKIIGDAIFKAKDGKMIIWLTNDERRMPVLIRSKVTVGSFDAELMRMTQE